MALTIDALYRSAYKGETEWRKVLLLTEILYVGDAELKVIPPTSSTEQERYRFNLYILMRYPNHDQYYMDVVKLLKEYVSN